MEVDEIQIWEGVGQLAFDTESTRVERNTDATEDEPYDALNLERFIQVYLEYLQLLLVL